MFDLGQLTDKFSESGQKVIYRAIEESKRREQNFLGVEHILSALGEVEGALSPRRCSRSESILRRSQMLEQELGKNRQFVGSKKMHITETTWSSSTARSSGRGSTGGRHRVLRSLCNNLRGPDRPGGIRRKLGGSFTSAREDYSEPRGREEEDETLRKKYELAFVSAFRSLLTACPPG